MLPPSPQGGASPPGAGGNERRDVSNVDGAEVILDVLDHGTKDPGNIPNQIHRFVTADNTCNPGCFDHQLAGSRHSHTGEPDRRCDARPADYFRHSAQWSC